MSGSLQHSFWYRIFCSDFQRWAHAYLLPQLCSLSKFAQRKLLRAAPGLQHWREDIRKYRQILQQSRGEERRTGNRTELRRLELIGQGEDTTTTERRSLSNVLSKPFTKHYLKFIIYVLRIKKAINALYWNCPILSFLKVSFK